MIGKFVISRETLVEILRAVEVLAYTTKIKIKQDGWHIRIVDDGKIAMVDMEIKKNIFMKYNIEEEGEVAVDVANILKFINIADKYKGIEINIDNNITIKAGNLKRTFALLNPEDYEDYPEPKIEYTATVQVETDGLNEIINSIRAINSISDDVYFELKNGVFTIRGNDDTDEITAEIHTFKAEGEALARYPEDYMRYIFKRMQAFQPIINLLIKIEYGNNLPIKISTTDSNGNRIFYMVAPKIIEEEIEW